MDRLTSLLQVQMSKPLLSWRPLFRKDGAVSQNVAAVVPSCMNPEAAETE